MEVVRPSFNHCAAPGCDKRVNMPRMKKKVLCDSCFLDHVRGIQFAGALFINGGEQGHMVISQQEMLEDFIRAYELEEVQHDRQKGL